MFGPRRHGRRGGYYRGGGGGGMGLLLMAMQFFSFFNFLTQSDRFFPITLGILALNTVVYFRPDVGVLWPSVEQACISARKVWQQRMWRPLFLSPFVHAHDYHLFYNMGSFMWKAVTLERHFGSGYFLYMTAVFSILTGLVYVAIETLLSEFLGDWSHMNTCAVGFSGVIFGLKVVTTHLQPQGTTMIMGMFPVPSRLACWAELVLISVLFPNVSFVGHLSGILVGVAFVAGPLKYIMDAPLSLVNFNGFNNFNNVNNSNRGHVPGHYPATPGGGWPGGDRRSTSYTYAARSTGYRENNVGRNEEEEELQEAIRLSLQQDQQQQEHPHHQQGNNQTTSTSNTDIELQTAIERSMTGVTQTTDVRPPSAPPPPFNPDYSSATLGEDSTLSSQSNLLPLNSHSTLSTSVDDAGYSGGSEKSLMPLGGGTSEPESVHKRELRRRPQHVQEDDSSDNSLAALRAARLKRFEKNK